MHAIVTHHTKDRQSRGTSCASPATPGRRRRHLLGQGGHMSATTAMRRDPPARRDRSHYLYLAVLAAVGAGIVVGFAAPGVAVELKPLGTGFVNLIKKMISQTIFFTIGLGIGFFQSP